MVAPIASRSRWNARNETTHAQASLDAIRIAVCAALLVSELYRLDLSTITQWGPYQPKGLLFWAFHDHAPSTSLVSCVRVVALASTTSALFGLCTRLSVWVSLAASWFLASLLYSFSGGFTHEYNVILLVELAVALGPIGRRFSLDALISNRREHPHRDSRPLVLAAQFFVVWTFFSGLLYKLSVSGPAWVFSDNFRNIVTMSSVALGRTTPTWLSVICGSETLFRGVALLNLICQGGIVLSLVFQRWPYRRLLFGSAFVFETLGLGFFMGRWDISPWNPHWLCLYAVFVDWDYFLRSSDAPSPASRSQSLRHVAIALVGMELLASAVPQTLAWAYPFAGSPMFSRLHGTDGSATHYPFIFIGPRFESPGVCYRPHRSEGIGEHPDRPRVRVAAPPTRTS